MDRPRGASVPLFPRKYNATNDFPGGGGGWGGGGGGGLEGGGGCPLWLYAHVEFLLF